MLAEFLATRNNRLFTWLNKVLLDCNIDPKCHIPHSIRFGHRGHGIVIGNAKIGENVLIMHNVTIGNNFLSDNLKFPRIGNNVKIMAGAMIIGDVEIGDNAVIGAGTVVVKDVPANSVAYNKRELVISRNISGSKLDPKKTLRTNHSRKKKQK